MPITTPEQVSRVLYAVYATVANKKNPTPIDRQDMPLMSILKKRMKAGAANGGVFKYKLKHDDGGAMQGWQRRDVLGFTEPEFQLEMTFPVYNLHMGREVVHEDLNELGYKIEPNGPRGKSFATPMSDGEAEILVEYFKELVESFNDKWDIELDKILHRDGSYDSKFPPGLDAMLPIANTTGTIGGVSRSNSLVRHYVETGLTTSTSGTLVEGMTRARYNAELNGRGHNLGGGLVIVAGSTFINGYRTYLKNNNLHYQWSPTKTMNGLDLGIPEENFSFEGIPMVLDPTFDVLDTLESPTVPWAKRAYFLAPKTWEIRLANDLDKKFSAPLDKGEQRVSRMSLDSRLGVACTVPNANSVVSVA